MIEAVGHEHMPTYFGVISRMLRPGGAASIQAAARASQRYTARVCAPAQLVLVCPLQAITIPDDRYDAYCNRSDFIRTHIFPGGHLPSIGRARRAPLPRLARTDITPSCERLARAARRHRSVRKRAQ